MEKQGSMSKRYWICYVQAYDGDPHYNYYTRFEYGDMESEDGIRDMERQLRGGNDSVTEIINWKEIQK